jgi:hypothetical protein
MNGDQMRVVHTAQESLDEIVHELRAGLGDTQKVVILFFAPNRPGEKIVSSLRAAWPNTLIIGCSTAGEISTGRAQNSSVVAAGMGGALVKRAAVACADYAHGVGEGVNDAVTELERTFGPLNQLDPKTHVGLVFIDSTHGVEESTHVELGNRAPLLAFVGGSAGDDLAFKETRVVTSAGSTHHGCALMLLELVRPFRVAKACHFGPTDTHFRVTKVEGRRLLELDGKPASEVYARYVGCAPEELSLNNLFMNPAGLVIDGQAWVRQVNPPVQDHGAITLGCSIAEGSDLYFLKAQIDLVGHLQNEIKQARAELGEIRGALLFDCALRRLELEATNTKENYARLIDFPAAGFHTHGESWLGHMHQTLTAIYFG